MRRLLCIAHHRGNRDLSEANLLGDGSDEGLVVCAGRSQQRLVAAERIRGTIESVGVSKTDGKTSSTRIVDSLQIGGDLRNVCEGASVSFELPPGFRKRRNKLTWLL